jgi:hypothetical protein
MLNKTRKLASVSLGAPLLGNMEGRFFLGAFLLEEFYSVFERYAKCPIDECLSP